MMKQFVIILFVVMAQHMTAQNNFLTIDQALLNSSQEGKPIMLVFSGSDWCKPCIQLKKNVLDTDSFSTVVEENLIVMYLDFPYKKANKLSKEETKHNEQLAEQYNKNGHFPKIVLIDDQGKTFGELIYKKGMTANNFITKLKKNIKTYENDRT